MPLFPHAGQRLLMLALNGLALLHLALLGLLTWLPSLPWRWKVPLLVAVLYLLPPLLARLLTALSGLCEGRIRPGSKSFFVWWAVSNLQVLFTRVQLFEELLRMVPGLYGLWLRAWGSKVSPFVYWGPGLRILDRGQVEIGHLVVFGIGVSLNTHVFHRNADGEMELILARIVLGDRSLVGGYSNLGPGTRFAADEVGRACLNSPPYSRFAGGRRSARS